MTLINTACQIRLRLVAVWRMHRLDRWRAGQILPNASEAAIGSFRDDAGPDSWKDG